MGPEKTPTFLLVASARSRDLMSGLQCRSHVPDPSNICEQLANRGDARNAGEELRK